MVLVWQFVRARFRYTLSRHVWKTSQNEAVNVLATGKFWCRTMIFVQPCCHIEKCFRSKIYEHITTWSPNVEIHSRYSRVSVVFWNCVAVCVNPTFVRVSIGIEVKSYTVWITQAFRFTFVQSIRTTVPCCSINIGVLEHVESVFRAIIWKINDSLRNAWTGLNVF